MKLLKQFSLVSFAITLADSSYVYAQDNFFDLNLEELAKVKIQPATLTKTSSKSIPAAITTISQADIRMANARSLNELLEIYVPGLEYIDHKWSYDHIGARGVMGDRDAKYLLLVNGRTMNDKTLFGVLTERDLGMMGDIDHIDVIRGAGSATYGVGAVSMVINIVTLDAKTFQGAESRTSMGAGEEFYRQEFKYGKQYTEDESFFMYAGIDEFKGASPSNAPQRFSTDGYQKQDGKYIPAGHDVSVAMANDKGEFSGVPKLKFQTDYKMDGYDFWARYTRGGSQKPAGADQVFSPVFTIGSNVPYNGQYTQFGMGSQQASMGAKHTQNISRAWYVDYNVSFDSSSYERSVFQENYREDEYLANITTHFEPQTDQAAALGVEVNHGKYGLQWPTYDKVKVYIPGLPYPAPQWSTNVYSVFGEHQWSPTNWFTNFISARVDDHTYTKKLFSPRWSMVFTPVKSDRIKLIAAKSQRMNFETDMRAEFLATGNKNTEPETLKSLEVRYEHDFMGGFASAVSVYKEKLNLIGGSTLTPNNQTNIANEEISGIEPELSWKTESISLNLSHAHTRLDKFELNKNALYYWQSSFVSVAGNGYGHNLNNWSNDITKFNARYKYNDKWAWYGSTVYYWGFQGSKDALHFYNDKDIADYGANFKPFTDYNGYSDPNWYLNLGTEYKIAKDTSLNITGQNLMGLFNEKYNKRNELEEEITGEYRIQAPSVSVALDWKF